MQENLDRILADPLVDEEICLRLASLADGEGHFAISKQNNGGFRCAFQVKMRHDDDFFLKKFQRVFGGTLHYTEATRKDGHKRQPQVMWAVATKRGCLDLILIFDAFPLWSKKEHDYEIWREAVIEWEMHSPGDDWDRMRYLAREIREVRSTPNGERVDEAATD